MKSDFKNCSRCNETKLLEEFHKNKNSLDGLTQMCKECKRLYDKNYCENNKDKVKERNKVYYQDNKQELKNNQRDYYNNNKETCLERTRKYKEDNKEAISEQKKQYYANNKEAYLERRRQYYEDNKDTIHQQQKQYRTRPEIKKQINSRQKQRYQNCPSERIRCVVSSRIREALKSRGGVKNCSTWSKLPYTPQQLKEHLESLWDTWMNWENYGKISSEKRTWQIDHIIPQSSLLYDSLEHPNFIKCWSLGNLRPLESIENIIKSNKLCLDNYK